MGARVIREHALQQAAAQFLDIALPPEAVHAAIDHAGKASKTIGAMLKARGGKKGFPDHLVMHAGKVVFLEFKSERGRVSPEQRLMHARLRGAGFVVHVVRSLPALVLALQAEGIPCRARIMASGAQLVAA